MINGIRSFNTTMLNEIYKKTTSIEKISARITSGKVINSAGDNPGAMLSISRFDSDIREHQTVMNNIQNGITMIDVAIEALNTVKTYKEKLESMSLQYAFATSSTDKSALEDKANRIIQNIQDTFNNTFYNGKRLFNGQEHYVHTGMYSENYTKIKFDDIVIKTDDFITEPPPNPGTGSTSPPTSTDPVNPSPPPDTKPPGNSMTNIYTNGPIPNTVDFKTYYKNKTYDGNIEFNEDRNRATFTIKVKNKTITGFATVNGIGLNTSKKNLTKLVDHLKVTLDDGTSMKLDQYLKNMVIQYGQESPPGDNTGGDGGNNGGGEDSPPPSTPPPALSDGFLSSLSDTLEKFQDNLNKKREELERLLFFQGGMNSIQNKEVSRIRDADTAKEQLLLIKEQLSKAALTEIVRDFNDTHRKQVISLLSSVDVQPRIRSEDFNLNNRQNVSEVLYPKTQRVLQKGLPPDTKKNTSELLYPNATKLMRKNIYPDKDTINEVLYPNSKKV